MDSNIVLPPSIDDVPPPGLALVEELDHTLMVQLRDGRKILGTLRSFDQFANLALEGARERVIVGKQYAEIPLGLEVIRGENVVLFGEIDPAKDPPKGLELVTEVQIKQAQRAEKEASQMQGLMRSRFDFLDDN